VNEDNVRKMDAMREAVKDEVREHVMREGLNEEKKILLDSMRESVCIELESMLKPQVEQKIISETQEKVQSKAQKEVEISISKKKKELEQEYFQRAERLRKDYEATLQSSVDEQVKGQVTAKEREMRLR